MSKKIQPEKHNSQFTETDIDGTPIISQKESYNSSNSYKKNETISDPRSLLMKSKLHYLQKKNLTNLGYLKWKYESIFSQRALYITESWIFQFIIIIAIFVAGITVGLQLYPQLDGNNKIEFVDDIILLLFIIEVVLKIVSYGTSFWQ